MIGPYGDFHPIFDSKKEMIWVGGGAGMDPLRAQLMHMTKTLHTTDRELHYFYGARALNEVFLSLIHISYRTPKSGTVNRKDVFGLTIYITFENVQTVVCYFKMCIRDRFITHTLCAVAAAKSTLS